jgi:chromosome segregation ATPase
MTMRRGAAVSGLVACALAGFALTLLAQVVEKAPQIESLFPTSVVGIVGTAMALLAFIDTVISRVKRPADAAANRVESSLKTEIKTLSDKVDSLAHEGEMQLHSLARDIEREATLCSDRAKEISSRVKETESSTRDLDLKMTQSREDRRHISQDVASLNEHVTRWREEDRQRDERRGEAAAARDERLFGMLTTAMGSLANAVTAIRQQP